MPIREPQDVSPDPPVQAPPRGARWRSRIRRGAGFSSGVVAALLAILLYSAIVHGPAPLSSGDVASQIAQAIASEPLPAAYSEQAYAAILPSLVEVQTDGGPGEGPAASAAPAGSPGPAGRLGSGVVINAQGQILTALHVVSGGTSIAVTFADGTQAEATISSTDPANDIAVLQPLSLPATVVPATLGNPHPAVGSDAYAVGNPFGLDGSISAGIVSAVGRSFQPSTGGPVVHNLIQIDAAVNPGSSGGPLVDRYGRVMGIVDALINPSNQDVFIGIGLAVPINVAGAPAGVPND